VIAQQRELRFLARQKRLRFGVVEQAGDEEVDVEAKQRDRGRQGGDGGQRNGKDQQSPPPKRIGS